MSLAKSLFLKPDLLPVMPPFMGRVCSGYALIPNVTSSEARVFRFDA